MGLEVPGADKQRRRRGRVPVLIDAKMRWGLGVGEKTSTQQTLQKALGKRFLFLPPWQKLIQLGIEDQGGTAALGKACRGRLTWGGNLAITWR